MNGTRNVAAASKHTLSHSHSHPQPRSQPQTLNQTQISTQTKQIQPQLPQPQPQQLQKKKTKISIAEILSLELDNEPPQPETAPDTEPPPAHHHHHYFDDESSDPLPPKRPAPSRRLGRTESKREFTSHKDRPLRRNKSQPNGAALFGTSSFPSMPLPAGVSQLIGTPGSPSSPTMPSSYRYTASPVSSNHQAARSNNYALHTHASPTYHTYSDASIQTPIRSSGDAILESSYTSPNTLSSRSPGSTPTSLHRTPPTQQYSQQSLSPASLSLDAALPPRESFLQLSPFSSRSPPAPKSPRSSLSPKSPQVGSLPKSPRTSISPKSPRSGPAKATSSPSPIYLSHSPTPSPSYSWSSHDPPSAGRPPVQLPTVRISSELSSSFESSDPCDDDEEDEDDEDEDEDGDDGASSDSFSPRSSSESSESSIASTPSTTPQSSPVISPHSPPRRLGSHDKKYSRVPYLSLALPPDNLIGAPVSSGRLASSPSSNPTHPKKSSDPLSSQPSRKSSSPRTPASPNKTPHKTSSPRSPTSIQDAASRSSNTPLTTINSSSPATSQSSIYCPPSPLSNSSSPHVRVPALTGLSQTHSLPASPALPPLPLSYRHSTSILEQMAPGKHVPHLDVGGELYVATAPYKLPNTTASTTTSSSGTHSNGLTANNTDTTTNRGRSGSSTSDPQLSAKYLGHEKRDEILKRMFLHLDDKNSIVAGTPEELVDNVLKESFIGAGMIEYMEDILLTYRYFLPSPHALLGHLVGRYNGTGSGIGSGSGISPASPSPAGSDEQTSPELLENKRWRSSAQLRVINVIKKWIEHHFSDFKADVGLLQSVLDFVDRDVVNSENHIWGRGLRDIIQTRLQEFIDGGDTETFSSLNLPSSKMSPPLLVAFLKQSGVVGDRRKLLARYKKAFIASEAVSWMMAALKLSGESEAIELMNKLIEAGLVQHVSNPSKPFNNSPSSMYRILDVGVRSGTSKGGGIGSSSTGDNKTGGGSRQFPEPLLPRGGIKNLTFADVDPLEIARQLTLIEYRIYKKIELSELTSQVWNKGGGINVVKMIERANDVSYWVATEIVLTQNIKERVQVLKKFIIIAEHCKSFNNWNTLMEIMIGLNLGCVQRLKKTWASLAKKETHMFAELSAATNSLGNYKTYRATIAAESPPFLPYLAVFLRDLTFIEDGNKDYVSEGVINFAKMKMLAHVFRQVLKFQQSLYAFADVPQLQKILSTDLFIMRQDRELYKYSNSCEPPQKSYTARMTLNMSYHHIFLLQHKSSNTLTCARDIPYLQQAIGTDAAGSREGSSSPREGPSSSSPRDRSSSPRDRSSSSRDASNTPSPSPSPRRLFPSLSTLSLGRVEPSRASIT